MNTPFAQDRVTRTLQHPLAAWVVLFSSLVVTAVAWQVSEHYVYQRAHDRFIFGTDDVLDAINKRMHEQEMVLRGGLALFGASQSVERHEWRAYVDTLDIKKNYPGLQGLGYSVMVPPSQRAAHVRSVRAEGFPNYDIKPGGVRETYSAIVYLEPFDNRNKRAFGYDMFSEPTRRAAMERARDSGEAALSGKVTLVQETETDVQNGFLMYVPVYRRGLPVSTVEERRAALQGFVYSPFRVKNLMRGILDIRQTGIDFRIYDGKIPVPATLLYESSNSDDVALSGGEFALEKVITLNGHSWTLRFVSRPGFVSMAEEFQPMFVAVGGVLIDLLIFYIISSISRRNREAEALAMKMTEEVRSGSSRLQAIVNNVIDGIITIDETGVIESFNAAAERIFHYRAEEVIGLNVSMLMPEPYRSEHDAYIAKYIGGGPAKIIGSSREVLGLRKEGTTFQMDLAVSEMYLGERRLFTGIVRDITERKQAQESLRKSQLKYQRLVEDIGDNFAIFSYSPVTGELFYVSSGFDKIFGVSRAEVVGKPWQSSIDWLPETIRSGNDAVVQLSSGAVNFFQQEMHFRHSDGSVRTIHVSSHAVRDDSGKVVSIDGIAEDITERKKIERLKSEFISTVSHELRTPLTSIRGALGLLESGALRNQPAKADELISIANKNANRLSRLINDILDLERVASGRMSFDIRRHSIMPLVEQAVVSHQSYAEQLGVAFVVNARLDSGQIDVDAERFQQVLANLLSNAAKFSPRGESIKVSVTSVGGNCRVAIADKGPGIPESFRPRMFEKFSQADASDTRAKGGSGLGLAISKEIVESMHGKIGYEDAPGGGSIFFIEFKLFGMAGSTHALEILPNSQRLLVVENNPEIAQQLALSLQHAGYVTDIAPDAASARRMIATNSYAAITLDLMLPGEDGLSFIRSLRSSRATRNLPVVIVSASIDEGKLSLGGEFTAIDWLSKPVDPKKLAMSIHSAVKLTPTDKPRVLHVEDDRDVHKVLRLIAGSLAEFDHALTLDAARQYLASRRYTLVVLDISLPDGSGWELLPLLQTLSPPPRVIVLSAHEIPANESKNVAALLVKSKTSNNDLLDTLQRAIHDSPS